LEQTKAGLPTVIGTVVIGTSAAVGQSPSDSQSSVDGQLEIASLQAKNEDD
jgi:hypothetical protein